MTEFQSKFEAYGGDWPTLMDRFMGDEEFYLQMLQMLTDDTCLQRMGQALDKGDLSAAFDAAHELKGVSGNLCLTPLYNAVCALVEPLRAREVRDYEPLYREACRAFDQALTLLPQ